MIKQTLHIKANPSFPLKEKKKKSLSLLHKIGLWKSFLFAFVKYYVNEIN